MIRVVVTGSECTGKTTLAQALADHFEAPCVPEYVRVFVQEQGRAPAAEEVETIARGQIALEAQYAACGSSLLILDTDLLSTVVYSRHYYGDCPSWVAAEMSRRAGDLYLLAGIDVPWVADGRQRDRGHRREEMQRLFHDAVGDRSLRAVDVKGSLTDRLRTAIAAVGAVRRTRRSPPDSCPGDVDSRLKDAS